MLQVHEQFILNHAQYWDEEPRQPIWRCVEHLITYIIRTIEAAAISSGGEDMKLTDREVKGFKKL